MHLEFLQEKFVFPFDKKNYNNLMVPLRNMNETISKGNSYVREDLITGIQIICLVLIARDTRKHNSNHRSSRTTRVLVNLVSIIIFVCWHIIQKVSRWGQVVLGGGSSKRNFAKGPNTINTWCQIGLFLTNFAQNLEKEAKIALTL